MIYPAYCRVPTTAPPEQPMLILTMLWRLRTSVQLDLIHHLLGQYLYLTP